jgi:hypothetical protein
MADLSSAVHVHSLDSQGTGTIPEIGASAAAAGVDVVVVVADRETPAGSGGEGWYGDTLVLVETETSPQRWADVERPDLPGALFGHARTHLLTSGSLTGSMEYDRQLVYDALRSGHCYVADDTLAPATGFEFGARNGSINLPMGGEGPAGGWTIEAELPLPASLLLTRDGEKVAGAGEDDTLSFTTDEAGVFRIEARLGSRLWILSSPIYLTA